MSGRNKNIASAICNFHLSLDTAALAVLTGYYAIQAYQQGDSVSLLARVVATAVMGIASTGMSIFSIGFFAIGVSEARQACKPKEEIEVYNRMLSV